MPTTRRSRKLAASPERVWEVLADPYHLPRWWPRVQRVEGVEEGRWTSVLTTSKGHVVRADYRVVESQPPRHLSWRQELEGSPFERLLAESATEVRVEPTGEGAEVRLALRQTMRGFGRLGGFMVRRATGALLEEALDGLERALGAAR